MMKGYGFDVRNDEGEVKQNKISSCFEYEGLPFVMGRDISLLYGVEDPIVLVTSVFMPKV